MAKYGTYDPFAPDPILEARRRGDNGFRDNFVAESALEQNRARNAAQAEGGDYRNRPGDISLSTAAARVAPAPRAPQAIAPPQTDRTPAVEESVRHASAPPKLFEDAKAILARGQFESPEWKSDYSLARVAQDEAARADISDRYRAGVARNNEEEALRGDPFTKQIQARAKTLAYENMMPAYSGTGPDGRLIPYEPSIKLNGEEQRQDFAPTWPTRGDVASIDRANAMMKPADRMAAEQQQARDVSLEKLRRAAEAARAKGMNEQQIADYLSPLIDMEAKKGALGAGDYKALADLLHPKVDLLNSPAPAGS